MSRASSLLLSGTVLASLAFPPPSARAQDAPPVPGSAAAAVTPPATVGRLAVATGAVSFHAAGADGWTAAAVNTPVSSGDAVFAEAGAHAEIEASSDLLALDGGTEFDVATLDDTTLAGSEPQGRLFAGLGTVPVNGSVSVATPRGTVSLTGGGIYEIAAGDSATPTTVTVVAGAAHLAADGLALDVGPGRTATVTGTDALSGEVAASGPPDPFLAGMLAAFSRFRDGAGLPPSVAGMTGAQALAGTGRWSTAPSVGPVWYPPVPAGWVPYREGHWRYVAPWGWTWIDDEPWGFAPFHYGRWTLIDDAWAWVPGDAPELVDGIPAPVYAPALVDWTDADAGLVAGAALGAFAAGAVGWIALGPHEPYVPPYRVDHRYWERLNRPDVPDIGRMRMDRPGANRTFGQLVNRGSATVMSAAALSRGEPVRGAARPFDRSAFGARPLGAGRPVLGAPTRPAARPTRGPALEPAAFRPRALPGQRLPFRASLAGAATAPPGRPGMARAELARPGIGAAAGGAAAGGAALAAAAAAGHALPGLRAHDAVAAGRPGPVPVAPVARAGRPVGAAMPPGAPSRPGDARPEPLRPERGRPGAGLAASEPRPAVAPAARPPFGRPGIPAAAPPGPNPSRFVPAPPRGPVAHPAVAPRPGFAPPGFARMPAPPSRPVASPGPAAIHPPTFRAPPVVPRTAPVMRAPAPAPAARFAPARAAPAAAPRPAPRPAGGGGERRR